MGRAASLLRKLTGGQPLRRRARIDRETAFELLASERRQAAIRYLDDNGATELGDLAVALAALEHDVHPSKVGGQRRKKLYVALYQTHLPRLHESGVVEYERASGEIRPGPALPGLRALLDCADDHTTTRS